MFFPANQTARPASPSPGCGPRREGGKPPIKRVPVIIHRQSITVPRPVARSRLSQTRYWSCPRSLRAGGRLYLVLRRRRARAVPARHRAEPSMKHIFRICDKNRDGKLIDGEFNPSRRWCSQWGWLQLTVGDGGEAEALASTSAPAWCTIGQ